MKSKVFLATMLMALPLMADVRVRLQIGAGHPIHRPGRMVVVRPMRPAIRPLGPSVVYAPPVFWNRSVVTLPGRDRLSREDSESISRREGWVDTTLDVNGRGNALYLNVDGRANIDFAEVRFGNGHVQVVDFREGRVERGTFQLLDFRDGRNVDSVRLIAKSQTPQSRLTVYLAK